MATITETPGRRHLHGGWMSVEEFLTLPDDGVHRELIRGTVREFRGDVEEPVRADSMTVRDWFHSQIEANVTFCLVEWWRTRPRPRGEVVCGEAEFRPDFETVAVHRPGREVQTLNGSQEFDGQDDHPGFRVAVARLFERD